MRHCLSAIALLIAPLPLLAQPAAPPPTPAAAPAKPDLPDLPPLPADRTVRQSAVIGGRAIAYDATVGALPVRDAKGKVIGEVVYTAYTVPGAGRRPVTFAFNGGPGASSVYLNLGAIGPKRVQFGAQGDAPSDPVDLKDNPESWLDFTDLVFIDPVGTGFSRSLVDEAQTKAAFYGIEPDIKYLSKIVYDWLVKNGRLRSTKYLVGESYGGYRVPRVAYELQTQLGVGLNGIVMVSPFLSPLAQLDLGGSGDGTSITLLPWLTALPSMAAAKLEREGRLTPAAMAEVEAYTRGEFATDLLKGRSDPQANARLAARVTALTGLDPKLVQSLDGRVDLRTYLREAHRGERRIGSIYDSNVTVFDPFPSAAQQRSGDPILDALIAPTTSAMVDWVTREVGWKTNARYNALSYDVNAKWDRGRGEDSPAGDLRKAIANDPKMGVLIVHGWDDLSCPYFASRLVVDQMPAFGVAERVKLAVYPGGHMFYSRADSARSFKTDARALYR